MQFYDDHFGHDIRLVNTSAMDQIGDFEEEDDETWLKKS